MKTINLLRPQHFATAEGEKIMIQAMMLNAYRQGIAQGERNMTAKVITRCNDLERRAVERRRGERRGVEGGITEKK